MPALSRRGAALATAVLAMSGAAAMGTTSAVVAARDALRPYDDGGMGIATDEQSVAFVAAEDAALVALTEARAKTPGEAAAKLDAAFIRMDRAGAWDYLSQQEDDLLRSVLVDLQALA